VVLRNDDEQRADQLAFGDHPLGDGFLFHHADAAALQLMALDERVGVLGPVGDPAGLAELMVFYCERAAGFCNDLGNQDEAFFDALVRMFEQALKVIGQLPAPDRDVLIARLDRVRVISHNFGYGVGDDMDSLLAKHSGLTYFREK